MTSQPRAGWNTQWLSTQIAGQNKQLTNKSENYLLRLQICKGRSMSSQASFLNESKKVWNAASKNIRKCTSLFVVKKRDQKICG